MSFSAPGRYSSWYAILPPDLLVRQPNIRCDLPASPRNLLHRGRIREDRDRFQKALPLLSRYQDTRRKPIARDVDSLATLFDVPKQLEKRILGLRHGQGCHGWPL